MHHQITAGGSAQAQTQPALNAPWSQDLAQRTPAHSHPHTLAAPRPLCPAAEWVSTVDDDTAPMWEVDWDDEDTKDDFQARLREELAKERMQE